MRAVSDDEKADVLLQAIEGYLAEAYVDDIDADDLSWVLVRALRRAGA